MNDKQQQAFKLYFQSDLNQQQIADILGIDRKTLYTWIKEGDWKRARKLARQAPSLLVEQYYNQLISLNDHIAAREEAPFATKEEAAVIHRLTMTIGRVRTGVSTGEVMEIFTDFTHHILANQNLEQAQNVMRLLTDYVSDLTKKNDTGYRKQSGFPLSKDEDEEPLPDPPPPPIPCPQQIHGQEPGPSLQPADAPAEAEKESATPSPQTADPTAIADPLPNALSAYTTDLPGTPGNEKTTQSLNPSPIPHYSYRDPAKQNRAQMGNFDTGLVSSAHAAESPEPAPVKAFDESEAQSDTPEKNEENRVQNAPRDLGQPAKGSANFERHPIGPSGRYYQSRPVYIRRPPPGYFP